MESGTEKLYPYMLFPDNVLPDEVMDVARTVVKCKYALCGTYSAALLRESGAWKLVIEPVEEMDSVVATCVAQLEKSGGQEVQIYELDETSIQAAHRRQMETLEEVIAHIGN